MWQLALSLDKVFPSCYCLWSALRAFVGKESFKIFYFQAESDFANSQRPTWDSDTYVLLDVIAANHLFIDASEAVVNVERRSIQLERNGVYFAFRDEGSCMTLLSVKVYYFECPPEVISLTSFPRSSPGGSDLSAIALVSGQCVANAVQAPATLTPTYLCKADGSWNFYSGSCLCLPGYQPNKNMTQCIGMS
jgi:Eph receptor B1